MSGPVPSPSMNGMMGLEGTDSFPSRQSIFSPADGTLESLYVAILRARVGRSEANLSPPKLAAGLPRRQARPRPADGASVLGLHCGLERVEVLERRELA